MSSPRTAPAVPTPHDWIVLDTSVVHETVRGNATLGIDLAALAALRGSAPVSLSLTAYIELTNQLAKQKFTFPRWQVVASALDAMIDPEHPIIPMGIALRVMLGVATCDESDLQRGLRGLRVMWYVLRTAEAPHHLKEGRRLTFEGERREFRLAAIKGELDERERKWIAPFERLVDELGRPVVPADRQWLAEGIRRHVGDDDVAKIPELETAVQLAVEWLVLHGVQYEKGLGYKPKLNDAMDFDQLFVLGLPAVICTSDGKFLRRVRSLGTPGSDRVLSPGELLDGLRAWRSK